MKHNNTLKAFSSTAFHTTMMRSYKHIFTVVGSGVLFSLDRLCKYFAFNYQSASWYLIEPWLGWEYFANTGIAFSLPFPQLLLLGITPLILLWFFLVLKKQIREQPLLFFSLCLIAFGAISNFIDRMLYGITIDYIRIATGILNIADLMIAIGIAIIFLVNLKRKNS
jgi:lipoprotein signal peptidase